MGSLLWCELMCQTETRRFNFQVYFQKRFLIVKDWMSWSKKSLQFVGKTPKSEWNNSNMTSSIYNLHSTTCKQNSTKRNDLNVKEKNCYIQNSLLMPTLPTEHQIRQYLLIKLWNTMKQLEELIAVLTIC